MTTAAAETPFEVFIPCEPDNLGPNFQAAAIEAYERFGLGLRFGQRPHGNTGRRRVPADPR